MKDRTHDGFAKMPAARLVIVALLAMISATGCFGRAMLTLSETQGNPTAYMGQPFDIRVGETFVLDSGRFRVTFVSVDGDSRCPANVSCIWEGDATVVLRLKQANRTAEQTDVHTSSRYATDVSYEDYRVKLQDLRPQPKSNSRTDEQSYIATLVVTVR